MLKSYLTTALRHLVKNTKYSVLNTIGLSVGLACFTLIGLWVKGELTYDRFHENADRIYRVAGTVTDESGKISQAVTPPPLALALTSEFPDVEAVVRIDKYDAVVKFEEKQFIEDDIIFADPAFFEVSEIGIRKVLGASVSNILGMLSKEFLSLIAISALIAAPVGHYLMNQWLNGFAYHVEIHPLLFVGAGALVLLVSWITLSARSISAAKANPVDSLKNE